MAANASNPYRIRSFQSKDRKACRRLYTQELLGTCLAPNDTGWDMDNIDEVYMRKPQNHFWVAVTDKDEVVGMLGVQHHEAGVGEVPPPARGGRPPAQIAGRPPCWRPPCASVSSEGT